MKKLTALLLALVMCLALAACGGDDSSSDGGDEPSGASGGSVTPDPAPASDPDPDPAPTELEDDPYTNYAYLVENVNIYEALGTDLLAGSIWELTGAYMQGQEITAEDLETVLEVYGGTLQIEFPDEETANLVQGGGKMPGTFRILDDGVTVNFAFETQGTLYPYVAVFTAESDDAKPQIVLMSAADPETALYMTLVIED